MTEIKTTKYVWSFDHRGIAKREYKGDSLTDAWAVFLTIEGTRALREEVIKGRNTDE